MFTPLRSVRKSDEVYEQLVRLIRAGRYEPGSRLPPERELAAQINASRQTVREALYRAELTGLIEVRHGAGSFVVALNESDAVGASLVELVTAQADRIAEIFDIRRLIEGWCASQAAKRATGPDLSALRQRLARMEQLELADPEWEQNDVAFHVALARATGNPVAVRMIEILRESFSALYRLKAVVVHNAEEKELVIRHHRDIYDAVRRREPEAASAAIVAHMDYVQSQLETSLRGSGLG